MIALRTPDANDLGTVLDELRAWQRDDVFQLHPGDVGWFQRTGAEATAAALRVWTRDGRPVAIALLDGPTIARLGFAPDALADDGLAARVAADLADAACGVLAGGEASVESPRDAAVRAALAAAGWPDDEAWTPLARDLRDPVVELDAALAGLRLERTAPGREHARTAAHRAAFDGSRFSDEQWRAMAAGPAYRDARCLVLVAADDADGAEPLAAATVWSAGRGRPGLLEPMGAHRDHRGRGLGRAITLAAAAELRALGASSATVATPSANVGGVAAYRSAGFVAGPERLDQRRP
jgi:GNAT superfamily N-acetyltransferase